MAWGERSKEIKMKRTKKPDYMVETIEVSPDGEYPIADLSDEQAAFVRNRFHEAMHGAPGKNPSLETKEEQSARNHRLEKKMLDRTMAKIKGKSNGKER